MEVIKEQNAQHLSVELKDINSFCLRRCGRATNELCRTLRLNTNTAKCNDLFEYFSERGFKSCQI